MTLGFPVDCPRDVRGAVIVTSVFSADAARPSIASRNPAARVHVSIAPGLSTSIQLLLASARHYPLKVSTP